MARPGDLDMTISAGVAAGAGEEIRYERLFRAADHALLEAKRAGRDRVEVAGDLKRRQDIVSGSCRSRASQIRSWTASPDWWRPAP